MTQHSLIHFLSIRVENSYNPRLRHRQKNTKTHQNMKKSFSHRPKDGINGYKFFCFTF